MGERFAQLAVDELAQGENVRFALSEIEELATDIRRRGILQPIVVIPSASGDSAEVLLGHRRLAAAKLAGLDKIPCILRDREPDVNRMLDQIAENVQRVNLSPIEEASCCKALMDQGLSSSQVGVQMQKSDTWVINRIRLLDLPQCLQDAVHNRQTTATKALDLPKHALNDEGVRRLEHHLSNGDGLGGWWRDYYAKRDRQLRAASPERPGHDSRATRELPPKQGVVTIHMPIEDFTLLRDLASASSVFDGPAAVAAGMLQGSISLARDEQSFGGGWEKETLRYIGGMTEAEAAEYDTRRMV